MKVLFIIMITIQTDITWVLRMKTAAKRVVKKNEKFNVPDQTEKEEAETHENAPVENLADNEEIKRRKQI
jgi:hypothetical protein